MKHRGRRSAGPGAALAIAVAASGCAQSLPPLAPSPPPPEAPRAATPADPLRLSIRIPEAIDIAATTLGLDESRVRVTFTNESSAPMGLGGVRLVFHVQRAGVGFPCLPRRPDDLSENADVLAPRASFTLETRLACWTPLPGTYAGRAEVSFGGARGLSPPAPRSSPFELQVLDARGRGPRPVPTHPGLYALAGGDPRTLPFTNGSPENGYHVAIVLVNAGPERLPAERARASLRVYAEGNPTPCAGDEFDREVPALEVGGVTVVRVPVTCIREMPGKYEVAVHLAPSSGDAPGVDVGRVDVEVTWNRNLEPL